MVPFLFTPREHHNVTSAAEYEVRQAAWIAERRRRGARFVVHEVTDPIEARVDANTWLVDCDCGAGNATDPEWGIACCFGCGAIRRTVIFPDDETRAAVEELLIARPRTFDRAWQPNETVDDLVAENIDHGFEVSDALMARAPARKKAGG